MRRIAASLAMLVLVAIAVVISACGDGDKPSPSKSLRVAIAPYQDMAMLTTHEELGLEKKYGTDIELVTLAWEDIIPSLASAGPTVDIGYGSLIEFLTKYDNINKDTKDPLVYVYPGYVFKGGGFVSFNDKVPNLDSEGGATPDRIREFLGFRIGAQKNSMFDMMIISMGRKAGIGRDKLKITDTTLADGLLAAQAGSLDAVGAGLTQRNEALERGGRVVLTMDRLGFADLTGFICKQSTLNERRKDIESLIKMWFDCADFVQRDIERNSKIPIDYLMKKSSTQYTPATYKRAVENEYIPRSLVDAQRDMVAPDGRFSIERISSDVATYLVDMKLVTKAPPTPKPIDVAR